MKMDLRMVKEENFLPRKFEIIPSTPIEEYILSDQQTVETSLSLRPKSSAEFKPDHLLKSSAEFKPDHDNLKYGQGLLREDKSIILPQKSEGDTNLLAKQFKKEGWSVDFLKSGYYDIKQNNSIERHQIDNVAPEVSKMCDRKEQGTSSPMSRSLFSYFNRQTKKSNNVLYNVIEYREQFTPKKTQKNVAEAPSQSLLRQDLEVVSQVPYLKQSNSTCSETTENVSRFMACSDISTARENNIHNKNNNNTIQQHHNNDNKLKKKSGISKGIFKCEKCSNNFRSIYMLHKHMSAIHPKVPKPRPFACEDCGKAYENAYRLRYHIFCTHNPSKDKYKCVKCHKYFTSQELLNHHLQKPHSKPKVSVPETCDICQKVFANRERMLTHRHRQHNTLGKIYICNDCSAEFTFRNSLVVHIKELHMAPELKCSLCNEFFTTTGRLRKHIMKKHRKNDQKPYICETCGKSFKFNLNLENHLSTHSDIKHFVCEDCGKNFRTYSNLKQHSVIHSDVRPFKCDICSKDFRIRHHLRQHMSVHGMVSTPNYNKRRKQLTTSEEEDDDDDECS